jgi:hypothetical protein
MDESADNKRSCYTALKMELFAIHYSDELNNNSYLSEYKDIFQE